MAKRQTFLTKHTLPHASPAGRLPKPPASQALTHSCTPFSPARVDNWLQQTLARAQPSSPWSARATDRDGPRRYCERWRSAVAGSHGLGTRDSPGTPSRTGVSTPAGTALRRQGRSVERAVRPTPPSSTAAPSHLPPRRSLRGVPTTKSSRPSGRTCAPVRAAARGPVSAAPELPSLLGCSHCKLGCQAAAAYPPRGLGNTLEQGQRLASPRCPPGGPHVLVLAACSRLCLKPRQHILSLYGNLTGLAF